MAGFEAVLALMVSVNQHCTDNIPKIKFVYNYVMSNLVKWSTLFYPWMVVEVRALTLT